MKKILSTLIFLFTGIVLSFAQPANDNCTTAQNLGSLPTPAACPSGVGSTITVAGTTVGATQSSPYPYMIGCSTGGIQQNPALDVWYSFVATGTTLNINLTSTFSTPNIGIWTGTCAALGGFDCAAGNAAGVLNYTNFALTPGQTYFIQVSGNTPSASGTFNLTIGNNLDCNNCLTTATLTASPAPIGGTYQAGQTVTICFTVNGYVQVASNWLHGIAYTFGAGWNLATLTSVAPPECPYDPTPGPGDAGTGTWGWYNSVTSAATGATYGPGFFFDNANVAGSNPGQNFGDPTNGACTWTFCVTLQVSNTCVQGQSLDISINTLADGESGSWTSPACAGDPTFSLNAFMACCVAPTMSFVNPTCSGGSNGSATATGSGTSPWSYSWVNSGGTTISSASGVAGPNTVTGLSAGSYTVTVTDNAACVSTGTVTLVNPPPTTTANAGPDQNVCGTTATLAGNAAAVGSGTWTLVSGTGTITTPSSPTSGITGLGVGANVFQWTITNPPCSTTSDQVTITGTASPTVANAGPDQNVCATTATLAGNAAAVGVGTWTLVSGAGTITTPSSPTSGVTGLGVGANVFQWTITNAPCASTNDQVTITRTASPTVANAGPDQTLCGTTATLAGNAAAIGVGTWTLVSGSGTITTPGSPTSGLTGLGVGTNVFQWTITNAPCPSTSDQVNIIITAAPTVANAGPDQVVCGTTATLAGNAAAIGVGTWTLVSGAGTITTPSSPTSGVTGLGVGANVFQWTITNAPCPPTNDQVTITGTASPTVANAGPDQTLCGTTATLAGNAAAIGVGTWTLVSGSGTITTPGSPTSGLTGLGVGTNVFQWTITNAPCPSTNDQVNIIITAAPTVANAGPDQVVCGTTATLAGNAAVVGVGTWTLVSGSGTITTPASPTSGITALGVGANVFQWTITNAPCPPTSDQVTITGTASPTVANAGPDQTLCGTTATLAGNAAAIGVGTWTLVSGTGTITTPGSPTSGLTGLGVGTNVFQWTITNAPCPSTSDQVSIIITAAPTVANAGPDQNVCGTTATLAGNAAAIGVGTWTLVSGAGTITTPASPTSGLTGLGVGANVFQWTITNAPCPPTSDQVTITGVASPTVANAGPDQTLCGSTTTLAGNAAVIGIGTWTLVSGAGTITTPSSPTSGLTGLGIGTNVFQWTITNAPCPPTSDQVSIIITSTPTVANAGADQNICGTTTTLAGNIAATGVGAWTLVSGSGIITTPASPTSGITGLGVGANVFQWTITSPPCTPSSDQVTITGVASPTIANAGPDQVVCGATATLAGNTAIAGTGTWTLVSGTGTITTPSSPTSGITGLGTGANVFQWTITNAPCAPTNDQVTITGTTSPTVANAGPDQVVCGATATLAGNAAAVGVGTWTLVSGAGTITTPSSPTSGITGLGVGANVFQWTITNAPCAPTNDQVTITGTASPTVANAGPDQTLCTTTATLAGNAAAVGVGTWTLVSGSGTITTPSSPTSGVTGLAVGVNVFQWTITNAPCPATNDQVTITINPIDNASFSYSASSFCPNGVDPSPTITGLAGGTFSSTAGLTLNSSTGTITLSSSTPATYTVTYTTSGPCPNTATFDVTINPVPVADGGPVQTLACSLSAATLSGSSSLGGSTFSWSGPGIVSGGTTANPSVDVAGVYTLTVSLSGCSSTDTVSVFSNTSAPNADAGTIQSLTCTTLSVILNGSSTTGGVTYGWTGGAIVSGGATATPTVNGTGVYTLTVTDPSNGCSSTDTVSVLNNTVPPNANAGTTQLLTCSVLSVNLNGSSSTAGATFSWSGAGISSGGTTATPTVNAAGVYTITVTDPSNGCTSTDTSSVLSNTTPPNANAGTVQTINCSAPTVNLNGSSSTAGATFSWAGAGIVSGGTTAAPTVNAQGVYTVTVTDPANGCTATDTTSVLGNTVAPVADAGTIQTIGCGVLSATLNGSGSASGAGITYNWTTAGGNIVSGGTTTNPSVDQPGIYTITVTNSANGCSSTDTVSVLNNPTPVASFSANPTTGAPPLSVNFTNSSSNANTYTWDFGDGNTSSITSPSDMYNTPGTYIVILVASYNSQCPDTAETTIIVFDNFSLVIPNIFSPNGDGNNDVFMMTSTGVANFKGEIFDRWGLKLFEMSNVTTGWDGHTSSGMAVPDGTYYYIFTVSGQDGTEHIYKGFVQVVK